MKAEYIQHCGTDVTIVDAARVSFDKTSGWENHCWSCEYASKDWVDDSCPACGADNGGRKPGDGMRLSKGDAKLISYLAKHNHFTPFTHATITLRETVPIFVARQRFKHVVGFTYNEVSRRYVDSDPDFFIPDVWRGRAENKKQGSTDERVHGYEIIDDDRKCLTKPEDEYSFVCEMALKVYRDMLAGGVCPEQARMVLPQSMMTSYYVTGSLAAFARLYKLRSDPHSQKEIQDLAKLIGEVVEPLFPVSWKALTE